MRDPTPAANLHDFLIERLHLLPPEAQLVLVLDPDQRLQLEATLTVDQQTWQVVVYDGNDLALRRHWPTAGRRLIRVVRPLLAAPGQPIDLSSLADLVRKAEATLDLSVIGVLTALVPGETWPAAPIERYADILAQRLDRLVEAHTRLRPHLNQHEALDAHSVRALVLHCLQPDIEPREFLFKQDTPGRVLNQYISLAWAADWDETGRELLRQQGHEASHLPLEQFEAWFNVATDDLAKFLYLYRSLSRMRVPNVVNQIRGLSVLGFDPEPLEAGLGTVLLLWDKDPAWRSRIIRQAEATLSNNDVQRAIKLLDTSTPDKAAEAIAGAEAPAFIYHLGLRLLATAYETHEMPRGLALWARHRPVYLSSLKEGDTNFARAALAMAVVLDEAAFVSARLLTPMPPAPDLARLLDWYIENQYYDLEFSQARAWVASNRLPGEKFKALAQRYLIELRAELRAYLDTADHELGRHVTGNWNGYLTHPRLATHVLRDYVKAVHLQPTAEACLWFIVFDGMRYDTWQKVVKPRLLQRFEVKREKSYLSVLPSWTRIARTSLIAGQSPDQWRGYRQTVTFNQEILAGIFFELPESGYARQLRFYSGLESDRTTSQFDRKKRYPYNVLVFNISDDDLHKQREHIGALNENVEAALRRIMDFLEGLIRPDDTVIISSDHGFTELDPEDAVLIKDDSKWQRFAQGGENPVRFRYISGVDRPDGLLPADFFSFEYRPLPDGKFTVPIGRKWFKREGTTQADRYAHGGLSLAEMVVPGAVLQLISEKKTLLDFENLPTTIDVKEDESTTVSIGVSNGGNQPAVFELTYRLAPGQSSQVVRDELAPRARRDVPVLVTSMVLPSRKTTEALHLLMKYTDINGTPLTVRREIPVTVQQRKDKVEISFGGLEDLDL